MIDPTDPPSGYALLWPHKLLRDELTGILKRPGDIRSQLEWLVDEAFRGPQPRVDVLGLPDPSWDPDVQRNTVEAIDPCRRWGQQLLEIVDRLPSYRRKQYYAERMGLVGSVEDAPSFFDDPWASAQDEWATAVNGLDSTGYFDLSAGSLCPDSDTARDHHETLRRLIWPHLLEEVKVPFMLVTPGQPDGLPHDQFLTLLEVVHDHVARPRVRYEHSFYDGHYDYGDCDEHSGQAVYRWKTNSILEKYQLGYRLADTGSDRGLVVTVTEDPRDDLIETVRVDIPDGASNQERIGHAISLFRGRSASTADKRSACKNLADVLENRRSLVKEHLVRKDEGALFQIANEYGIRHHDARQRTDYDQDVFLDWVFWNYLATVELTNRLIARGQSEPTDE